MSLICIYKYIHGFSMDEMKMIVSSIDGRLASYLFTEKTFSKQSSVH